MNSKIGITVSAVTIAVAVALLVAPVGDHRANAYYWGYDHWWWHPWWHHHWWY